MTNAIIILDGYGYSEQKQGNAIAAAHTPYLDMLKTQYPTTLLNSSGRDVGLPKGQMGNSEVGHLNLGAGRIVYQDITTIDCAIEDGSFFENPAFLASIENVKAHNSTLHLMGLLSSGGVHSMNTHLYALLELAKKHDLKKVYIHCITDGRDVPPDSGQGFIKSLEQKCTELNIGKIATIVGRYYIMDRDNRWERVERGYNCVFAANGDKYTTASAGIAASYAKGKYDEFIEPIIVGEYSGINDNDSLIFFNFRSDRAREISRAILYPDFAQFPKQKGHKYIHYTGMTTYDITLKGIHTAFAPKEIINTLGEYLSNCGKTQCRIAETEKYAHVTFFFNGGTEAPYNGEQRVLIPSPKVATYDMQPQMSAYEIAAKAVEIIQENKTDVMILNFANCDMVGHTGVFKAAVKAIEAVDSCLKIVTEAIIRSGGTAIITSDHGNAELMTFSSGSPCTSHTTNPVILHIAGEKYKTCKLRNGGSLCDVAPTLLEILNLQKPAEMSGLSLIEK